MNFSYKCDRCKSKAYISIMSMFNEDILCMPCKDKEIAHPKYNEARDVEAAMVRNNIFNFEGIGKPGDL